MIICSNCKHANVTGTMFCVECGAQLIGKDTLVTQSIGTDIPEKTGTREVTEAVEGENAWANLHLLETGQVLPLTVRNEFTMGRISEGQPIMPDIDLSPYQAYAAGVSRLHAVIKRSVADAVIFMDLGSANGSFLNGNRLEANKEQSLRHGDIIALGKLRMQVLIDKK